LCTPTCSSSSAAGLPTTTRPSGSQNDGHGGSYSYGGYGDVAAPVGVGGSTGSASATNGSSSGGRNWGGR
jgi:hypothetical protein